MPRPLRVEFAGAIYHLMNRGDRREPIFLRSQSASDKVSLARRLRRETPVTRQWIAGRLGMGSASYVSHLLGRTDPASG